MHSICIAYTNLIVEDVKNTSNQSIYVIIYQNVCVLKHANVSSKLAFYGYIQGKRGASRSECYGIINQEMCLSCNETRNKSNLRMTKCLMIY